MDNYGKKFLYPRKNELSILDPSLIFHIKIIYIFGQNVSSYFNYNLSFSITPIF